MWAEVGELCGLRWQLQAACLSVDALHSLGGLAEGSSSSFLTELCPSAASLAKDALLH